MTKHSDRNRECKKQKVKKTKNKLITKEENLEETKAATDTLIYEKTWTTTLCVCMRERE